MKVKDLNNDNSDKISIQQEADAYAVAQLLKDVLGGIGVTLSNWRATWSPAGFNIEGIKTDCSDEMKVRKVLEQIKPAPGQAPIQLAQYNKMKNTYNVVAVLNELREKLKPMGLTFKAVTHQNDYPIISFFEAPPEEPEPELPLLPPLPGLEEPLAPPAGSEEPVEEPIGGPGLEEPLEEPEEGEGEGEEGLEEIPIEKVDWDTLGV